MQQMIFLVEYRMKLCIAVLIRLSISAECPLKTMRCSLHTTATAANVLQINATKLSL